LNMFGLQVFFTENGSWPNLAATTLRWRFSFLAASVADTRAFVPSLLSELAC
jgi:hypothetical protein